MTKVDFYIASEPSLEESIKLACRLVEKAWRRQHNIYIHTSNAEMMKTIDDALWSFRPNSFVPHRCENSTIPAAKNSPDIIVACSGEHGEHHDVLINTTETTPDFFGRFTRIAEIVRGEEQAKAKSRERYKYYRSRGYPLDVHHL